MSTELIDRSTDLKHLRDEGYGIEIVNGFLLVNHVPYVNDRSQVAYGILVSRLDLAGNVTTKPKDHVALWTGDYPYSSNGKKLENLVNNTSANQVIVSGLVANISFSQKPEGGYDNYYQKMTSYIHILEGEARAIDSSATAQTYPFVKPSNDQSVFWYEDTASSRANIADINDKLRLGKIAIVGLGGTGSYILDLLAKSPVEEIHLFDGDIFLQHNAFRVPGAASEEELAEKPMKVEWLSKVYSRLRRKGIVPHPEYIDENNVLDLSTMTFVFLCLTNGHSKRAIVDFLISTGIPFIDAGMGLRRSDGALDGLLRVTTFIPNHSSNIYKRVPFSDGEDDEYSSNVQTADLNALNAVLAVIKWKKITGFYVDTKQEYNSTYGVSMNLLTNDEG